MCWSKEVTLAFLLLEAGCCVLLAVQHLHGLLLGFGPLVLQELIQLLLWLEIDDGNHADGTCSAANSFLSFVQLIVVCGLVPIGFALMAVRSLDQWHAALAAALGSDALQLLASEDAEAVAPVERNLSGSLRSLRRQRRRLRRHVVFIAGVAAFEVCYAASGLLAGWWRPFCTVRGSLGGHQLWPFMETRLPSRDAQGEAMIRLAVWLLYFLLVAYGVVAFGGETATEAPSRLSCRRGRLPLLLLVVLTPSLLPPLWLRWGADLSQSGEFGSVWCWGASAALLAALAEPRLAAWAHECHARASRGASTKHSHNLAYSPTAWVTLVGAQVWRELMAPPQEVIETEIRASQNP